MKLLSFYETISFSLCHFIKIDIYGMEFNAMKLFIKSPLKLSLDSVWFLKVPGLLKVLGLKLLISPCLVSETRETKGHLIKLTKYKNTSTCTVNEGHSAATEAVRRRRRPGRRLKSTCRRGRPHAHAAVTARAQRAARGAPPTRPVAAARRHRAARVSAAIVPRASAAGSPGRRNKRAS